MLLIATIFVAELRLVIIHSAEFVLNRPLNITLWDSWIQHRAPFLLAILFFFALVQENYTFKTNLFNRFFEFIFKNHWPFLLGFGALLLIYGQQLYISNGRIDVSTHINTGEGVSVSHTGRYGDRLTRILFEGNDFNPYYSSILAFLFLGFALILFSYLCKRINNLKPTFSTAIFTLFMVHPIWMEQFYFNHQIMELFFGILLIFLTLNLIYKVATLKCPLFLILIAPLFVWIIATYQSLAILYFAATLFLFLIHFIAPPPPQNLNTHEIAWRFSIYAAVVFVIGYILNEVVAHTLLNNIPYLQSQICWKHTPANFCSKAIINYLIQILGHNASLGTGYGIGFGVSALVLVIIALRYAPRPLWLFWGGIFLLELAPFILPFYLGNGHVPRSQITLPFVIAMNFALAIILVPRQNVVRFITFVIAIFIFFTQANGVLRLQYTDELCFQNDLLLMNNVEQRVALVRGANLPLVVVGGAPYHLNNIAIEWDLLGKPVTMFATFFNKTPDELHNFAKAQGVIFKTANAKQKERGLAESQTMPVFPADGSVKNMGDFVVVKLGEPSE